MTVNMDKDYEDLYSNLDSLLKDICKFLKTNSPNMSPAAKKKADALIERSKTHLQIIEKISNGNKHKDCGLLLKQLQETAEIINSSEAERYVDMTKKPALPQRSQTVEQPAPVCDSKCPFEDLPAKEASQEMKYGPLTKRRKVLNIIDVSTKIYAVVHANWLLIYNSSKDLKPDCALDLKQYKAYEDETDPNLTQVEITKDGSLKKNTITCKMASSFKVFDSSSSSKKSYNFVAITHKDMLQWVANINRQHDKAVSGVKQSQGDETYELCQNIEELDEENIYNEIEMPCRSTGNRATSKENDPPGVPEKRPIIPPSISSSITSMVSYEELERKGYSRNASEECSLASFETSDEEEDQTYYELDLIVNDKVNGKQNIDKDQIDFNMPQTSGMSIKIRETDNEDKETAYQNGIVPETTQLTKTDENNSKIVVNKPSSSAKKFSKMLRVDETTAKADFSTKNVSSPLITKPKILSPKPWKPFKKNAPSDNRRSPQITKNKPIRESLKCSLNVKKTSTGESSGIDISSMEKKSAFIKDDNSKTSNDICSSSHQDSSIVQIVRNRWSTSQSLSCNLETFSRTTKIETFQASPTKESPPADFSRSSNKDLNDSLIIDTLVSDLTKNGNNEDEKPMVLLKASLEEENSSKKLKKSPVVPVRPKKVAKKLAL